MSDRKPIAMMGSLDTVAAAMAGDVPAYGLWFLAALNAGIFILFAFSCFKPEKTRDWRSFGAFSAFIVALFAEMYGFPPTLYLLAGRVGSTVPAFDPLLHDAGHLWPALFGWSMNPHFSPFHLLSQAALFAGLLLIGTAASVAAQTSAQQQDEHHPAETQVAPPASPAPGDAPAAAAPGSMPGMGMMTPEMMQMMQRMMGRRDHRVDLRPLRIGPKERCRLGQGFMSDVDYAQTGQTCLVQQCGGIGCRSLHPIDRPKAAQPIHPGITAMPSPLRKAWSQVCQSSASCQRWPMIPHWRQAGPRC